jgi:hypothetical protein
MKVLSFILGLVAGAIGAVGLAIYLPLKKPANEDSQIIFAGKNFLDSKQNNEFGYVAISGTLTGQDAGYSNNTYGLSCIKRFNACFVAYVEQVGRDQIGIMQDPIDYPIVKWNDSEVVAEEEPSSLNCFKVTITIDRKREELLWVEEPINRTEPTCKNADMSTRKYTIEDSPRLKHVGENERMGSAASSR